jgi:hypothetical protein
VVKWAQIYIKCVRHISYEKLEDLIGVIINLILKTDNNTTTKRQRTTIQRAKVKEQQYYDQKTKSNNTASKRQRTTIQRPKDKEQQYNDQKTKRIWRWTNKNTN